MKKPGYCPILKGMSLQSLMVVLCILPLQELILGGLKAETPYSVSVAAFTTKGDGAHSKAKLVQTPGIGKHMPSLQFSALDLVTYSRIDLAISCSWSQQ